MNRRTALHLRLLALVAVVALCPAARAQEAKREAAAKPSASQAVAQIPFELNGNQIFLRVRVNGSEPLWFALDTGASVTVVNTTAAAALGLKLEAGGKTTGAGGQVQSSAARGVRLDPEPFEYDMSGLQVVTESPAFRTMTIFRVLPDSPAAEAGLRAGDEIVSVGGRPATELRLTALREMLRRPDALYTLEVRRGAETVSVELRTRRMI